jgi:hypothetical protein
MSGNGLYDPDQIAVNTRWVQPWSEAGRVRVKCLSRVLCDDDGCTLWRSCVSSLLSLYLRGTILEELSLYDAQANRKGSRC